MTVSTWYLTDYSVHQECFTHRRLHHIQHGYPSVFQANMASVLRLSRKSSYILCRQVHMQTGETLITQAAIQSYKQAFLKVLCRSVFEINTFRARVRCASVVLCSETCCLDFWLFFFFYIGGERKQIFLWLQHFNFYLYGMLMVVKYWKIFKCSGFSLGTIFLFSTLMYPSTILMICNFKHVWDPISPQN